MLTIAVTLAILAGPKGPQPYLDFSQIHRKPYRLDYSWKYVYSGPALTTDEDWSGLEEGTGRSIRTFRPYGNVVYHYIGLSEKLIGLSPALAKVHQSTVGKETTSEYTPKGLFVSTTSKTAYDYYYAYPQGHLQVGSHWPGFVHYANKEYPTTFTLTALSKLGSEPCAEVTMNGVIRRSIKGDPYVITILFRDWFSVNTGVSLKSMAKKTFEYHGKSRFTVWSTHKI